MQIREIDIYKIVRNLTAIGAVYILTHATCTTYLLWRELVLAEQTIIDLRNFHDQYSQKGCTSSDMKPLSNDERIHANDQRFAEILGQMMGDKSAKFTNDDLDNRGNFDVAINNMSFYNVNGNLLDDRDVTHICHFLLNTDGKQKLILLFDQPLDPPSKLLLERIVTASGPRMRIMEKEAGETTQEIRRRAIKIAGEPNRPTISSDIPLEVETAFRPMPSAPLQISAPIDQLFPKPRNGRSVR